MTSSNLCDGVTIIDSQRTTCRVAEAIMVATNKLQYLCSTYLLQESPAIADKPARRESLPKIAPIRRAYKLSQTILARLAVVVSEICEIPRNSLKIQTYGVQGHRSWCQSKSHVRLPISH